MDSIVYCSYKRTGLGYIQFGAVNCKDSITLLGPQKWPGGGEPIIARYERVCHVYSSVEGEVSPILVQSNSYNRANDTETLRKTRCCVQTLGSPWLTCAGTLLLKRGPFTGN